MFDGRSRRVWRRFLSCGDRMWGDALRFLASRGLRSVCSSSPHRPRTLWKKVDRRVMEFARWWAHSRLPRLHWSGWGQGLRCWQLSPLSRLLSSNRGPHPFTNFLTRSRSKMTRGQLELFIHWGHFPRHLFILLSCFRSSFVNVSGLHLFSYWGDRWLTFVDVGTVLGFIGAHSVT